MISRKTLDELKKNNRKIAELMAQYNALTDKDVLEVNAKIKEYEKKDKLFSSQLKKDRTKIERKLADASDKKVKIRKVATTVNSILGNINSDISLKTRALDKLGSYNKGLISSTQQKIVALKQGLFNLPIPKRTENKSFILSDNSKIYSKTIVIKKAVIASALIPGITPTSTKQEHTGLRKDDNNNTITDILKSIESKLTFGSPKAVSAPDSKSDKEEDKGGFSLPSWATGLMGGAGGIGAIASGKKLLGKVAGKVAGKIGVKTLGKFAGRAVPLLGAAMSVYSLVKHLKGGWDDYQQYSKAGNSVAASGVLSYTLVGAVGDLAGILGGFVPGLGIPLTGLSILLDMMSDKMKENNQKSAYLGEDAKKAKDLLASQEKTKILQMRPNTKGFWEYKDYNAGMFGDDWKPVMDNTTGKPLSILKDANKVEGDNSVKGYTHYTLSTVGNGKVDLVYDNGPKMKTSNGGILPINTGEVKTEIESSSNTSQSVTQNVVITSNDPSLLKVADSKMKEASKKSAKLLDLNSVEKAKLDDEWYKIDLPSFNDIKKSVKDVASGMSAGAGRIGKNLKEKAFAISDDVKAAINSIKDPAIRRQAIMTAGAESRFITTADAGPQKNGKAGAAGLFQMMPNTWNGIVNDPRYPQFKGYTLDDRKNPMKAAAVYQVFQKQMNAPVTKYTKGTATDTDYYMANFLGTGGYNKKGVYVTGARDFYNAMQTDPNKIGTDIATKSAIDNNINIFYKDGKGRTQPRTVSEIYEMMTKRIHDSDGLVGQFETGTNKVMKSGPALIHQGEMIIPAKNANKIRSAIHSNSQKIVPVQDDSDDEMSEDFWINTFMVALANVVKTEYLGAA